MAQDQTMVTKNLLNYCYTCDQSHECDTEAVSVQCWDDKGFAVEEVTEEKMTGELLRQYAE